MGRNAKERVQKERLQPLPLKQQHPSGAGPNAMTKRALNPETRNTRVPDVKHTRGKGAVQLILAGVAAEAGAEKVQARVQLLICGGLNNHGGDFI